MKPIYLLIVLATMGASFPSCPAIDKDLTKKQAESKAQTTQTIKITYLGVGGWEIQAGGMVFLLDPYLSRLLTKESNRTPGDTRKLFGPNDPFIPDTAAIDAHIKRADYILIHHAHADHVLDTPDIARKTRATVIGNESTTNLLRASGIPEEKLITVSGGEDYEFGQFSLRVLRSLHAQYGGKRYYQSRVIPPDIQIPALGRDYAEGGSLAFLIRVAGHQILTFGSTNFIEREVDGLRPDVAIVGADNSRSEIHDYTNRLMRALGFPPVVVPTNWDDYFLPLSAPQEASRQRLQTFVKEVNTISPRSRVLVPIHFEPISIKSATVR